MYNSPSNKFIPQDLDTLTSVGDKVLIVGDFTARHRTWNNHINNKNGLTLYDYATNNNLIIQYTKDPTHYPQNNMTPTCIDILLNKNVSNITTPISLPVLSSDHNPVQFYLENINKQNHTQKITSYKFTEWVKYKKDLDK